MRTIPYTSWNRFVSSFVSDLCGEPALKPERFIFRGQGDANYKLRSSFDRRFESIPLPARVRKYERLRGHFRNLYEKRFNSVENENTVLSAAQHYGLPTRLLDWSGNPFVAAYFAFSQAALNNQKRGRVAIWALDIRSSVVHADLGLTVFQAATENNERAQAQNGFFSHLTGVYDSIEAYIDFSEEQPVPPLCRFVLPVAEAQTAFSFLNLLSFNAYSLFPDIQGIVMAALEDDWLKATLENNE